MVNVLSVAWDIYDAASLGIEAYNMVTEAMQQYDPSRFTTFEIRPDVSLVDADGKVKEIYDFKFDRPASTAADGKRISGYQDSMPQDQRDLYNEKLKQGGTKNTAKEINQDLCQCK